MLITCRLTTTTSCKAVLSWRRQYGGPGFCLSASVADFSKRPIDSPAYGEQIRSLLTLGLQPALTARNTGRPRASWPNQASEAAGKRALRQRRDRVRDLLEPQKTSRRAAVRHNPPNLSPLYLSERRLECKQIIYKNCHSSSLDGAGPLALHDPCPPGRFAAWTASRPTTGASGNIRPDARPIRAFGRSQADLSLDTSIIVVRKTPGAVLGRPTAPAERDRVLRLPAQVLSSNLQFSKRSHLMGAAKRCPDEPEPVTRPLALSALLSATQIPLPLPGIAPPPGQLALPPKIKPKAVMPTLPGRCLEKGCVFPAAPGGGGRCLNHLRQQQEPALYCSYQPSSALVARSKFGPPKADELERVDKRGVDRRRLMAERERFLNEQQ